MCGIAGIIRISDRPLPDPQVVDRMISAIAHRGPDDQRDYRDEFVHLAAARLSIQDVAHGQQPVATPDGEYVGLQNGEIYNFRELATELKSRGHRLSNQGDTVVLPHLYQDDGAEMVHRLRGMYAFAVWDRRQRRLLLCRDRLGIKPLFYTVTDDYLIFGSEIKAILASELVERAIDRDSLDDLFSMSYPCPPRTMFKDIVELRPAHRLVVEANAVPPEPERYWRMPFVARGEHQKLSYADACQEYRERLTESVQTHMVSDVPVGAYVSGGVDSSIVAALMKQVTGEPPEAFTIGFAGSVVDETSHAKTVTSHLGTKHHLLNCDENLAEHLPSMIYHTELPLQYPVALPMLRLSKFVREHGIHVVLTGEGADEQLGGYACFRLDRLRRRLSSPLLRWLRPMVYRRLFSWLGEVEGVAELFIDSQKRSTKILTEEFSGIRPPWYDIWTALDLDRDALLAKGGRRVRPIWEAPSEFSGLVRPDIADLHPLDAGMALEIESRLPSWVVLENDRAAMANGVESRVPLLDHRLMEWTASLPPQYKLRGLNEKAILKKVARDLLPSEICDRKKQPFYSPIGDWFFSDQAPAFVYEYLSESRVSAVGLFNPSTVSRLRQQLRNTPANHILKDRIEWVLLLVLSTQLLHTIFVDGESPYSV